MENKLKIDSNTIDYIAKCWSKHTWIRRTFQVLFILFTLATILLITGGIGILAFLPTNTIIIYDDIHLGTILVSIGGTLQLINSSLIKPFVKKMAFIKNEVK